MKIILIFLIIAAVCVSASPHVLYSRNTVPSNWVKGPAAAPTEIVEFSLALKQRNLDILDKWFWEASNPDHENYQNFLEIDQIKDLVSPLQKDVDRVWKWLHANGIHHDQTVDFGDAMDVTTSVKHASTLFNTKFYVYTHKSTGAKIVRQFGDYSIPAELKDMIEIVTGLSTFPIPHLRLDHQSPNPVSNDCGVIPQTVDNLYGITQEHRGMLKTLKNKHVRQAAPYTDQGVIEFQGENYAPADLQQFATGVDLNLQTVSAAHTVGPNDPTNPQVEAALDIEMIEGVNLGATDWFWLEQGQGWLYQFGIHFFSTTSVPQVNSISYGWWEGDQCTIDPNECQTLGVDSTGYTQRVNTEFQKIALRGITLISASGDSGANGRTDPDCTVPQLRPSFPASSPYITAVGATEIPNPIFNLTSQPPICAQAGLECASGGTEQAVSYAISNFASGGGFSNINAMPDYQQAAVSGYLNSGVALPPASYFNTSGRAFPDIAANGHNALIVDGGSPTAVGGTSQAAPIVAAVIALLNVAQIEKTGKPLGFLNPFLYKMASDDYSTFNDITVGDNKCTEDGCGAGCQGYLCTVGWDPVTGLGTPNFPNMLKYVQSQEYPNKKNRK